MEVSEQENPTEPSGEEFWRIHLLAAERFSGSGRQYCLDHGLNYGTFSAYKTKLGFSRQRGAQRASSGFVEVRAQLSSSAAPIKEEQHLPCKPEPVTLPDARWVAEFALALLGHGR